MKNVGVFIQIATIKFYSKFSVKTTRKRKWN